MADRVEIPAIALSQVCSTSAAVEPSQQFGGLQMQDFQLRTRCRPFRGQSWLELPGTFDSGLPDPRGLPGSGCMALHRAGMQGSVQQVS